ncbi:hypothetical protein ACLPIE_22365, partial [Providencia sp. Me31A]
MGKNSSHYTGTGLLAHQRAGRGIQQQQAGRVTRRDTARGYQLYHYDVNGRLEKKIVHEQGYRPR